MFLSWSFIKIPQLQLGKYKNLGSKNFYLKQNKQLTLEDFPNNGCIKCHSGIEKIDNNHNFSCEKCHGGDIKATTKENAHKGMVRDPSYGDGFKKYCLKCHQKEYNSVSKSIHYTMSGVINITRYEFDAQSDIFKKPYVANEIKNYKIIPRPVEYPLTVSQLSDHLLRTKCMVCHVNSNTLKVSGMMRGKGCSACHIYYSNDGVYSGGDKTIRGKKGYPVFHQFIKKIPTVTCLHCHHGNRIGGDFIGLFEKDYHRRYRSDLAHGDKIEAIYGQDYHKLLPDIHYQKGLHCVDCHGKKDIMGNGKMYYHESKVKKVSCLSCHGKVPDTKILKNVKKIGKSWVLISKVTGKKFKLKYYNKNIIAHKIPGHKKLSCIACHSRWMAQDYGYHLIREDNPRWRYWKDYYIQGDPWITQQFFRYFKGNKPASVSYDYSTGESIKGIWFSGYSLRRWENPALGYEQGKGFYPVRPEYQYYISYNNTDTDTENVINSKRTKRWSFATHSPHTIARNGRSCESCHGSSKTVGKGIRHWDINNKRLSKWELYPLMNVTDMVVPGQRKLTVKEQKKLLNKSKLYKLWRYKAK